MKKNVLREKRALEYQAMLRAKKESEVVKGEIIEKPKRVKKNVNNSK